MNDDFRQEGNDKAFADLYDRLFDLVISCIPKPAQEEVANNMNDIRLD